MRGANCLRGLVVLCSVVLCWQIRPTRSEVRKRGSHDSNVLQPDMGDLTPLSLCAKPGPCDPAQLKQLLDEHKEIAKKSETLTHVKVKPGGISKGDFDNYAVPYIKRVREETRKEERTKLRIVTNREEEKKKEERVKSEQVHKKEELAKKQHEEIGKKYHEAALKRDAVKEAAKKEGAKKTRLNEFYRKKKTEHGVKRKMKYGGGASGFLGCKRKLPGFFQVVRNSVLVRTTVDMRPYITSGEAIQFYDTEGGSSIADFTLNELRDQVTITINDPYQGHTKTVKACKIDSTPITLEGYTPLKGAAGVLSGSRIVRTSESWLGFVGQGDTIRIGSQEFTVKLPMTNNAVTLDRPWPTNAGQKDAPPVKAEDIQYFSNGQTTVEVDREEDTILPGTRFLYLNKPNQLVVGQNLNEGIQVDIEEDAIVPGTRFLYLNKPNQLVVGQNLNEIDFAKVPGTRYLFANKPNKLVVGQNVNEIDAKVPGTRYLFANKPNKLVVGQNVNEIDAKVPGTRYLFANKPNKLVVGQNVNAVTAHAKKPSGGKPALLVQFDCKKLANGLCKAADVGSEKEVKEHHHRFRILIYDDKTHCCTQDHKETCGKGACVRTLRSPIGSIHVEVLGKKVFYYVENGSGDIVRKRRQLLAGVGRGRRSNGC